MSERLLLGITGGIGSGKSYVASILAGRLGIPVYDCDSRAKRLNEEDGGIRSALTALVGRDVYDGPRLVKPVLAAYLFAGEEHARRVADIVHHVVRRDLLEWAGAQDGQVLAVESAILYESGFDSLVDKVIFVDATPEVRLSRAMRRDSSPREQIESRMAVQRTGEARKRADFVLLNDGRSDAELERELKSIITSIRNKPLKKETC